MVDSINNQSSLFGMQTAASVAKTASSEKKVADENANAKLPKNEDTFVKDGTQKDNAGIYEKPKKMTVDQLKEINAQQLASFNQMIGDMLGVQVNNVNKAMFSNINVSAADKAKAQASIAEGGEFSVDAVSTRLLDMAKALSGGDASKFDTLRNAVEEGFAAAEKQWGAELPEISKKTYEKTMQGFDEWKKELEG